MQARLIVFHQTEIDELAVRLPHLWQNRTSSHRYHGVLRQLPTKLFGDLKAVCLRAFRVEGPQVHVDETERVLAGDLTTQSIHVVVVAPNLDELRPEHLGAEDLALF